jgi:hypothetical protein
VVTLSLTAKEQAVVATRDFSGQEIAHVVIDLPVAIADELVLSPAGDRVALSWSGSLWNAQTGAQVLSLGGPIGTFNGAAFTSNGDRVLLADGVFRAEDGMRLATVPYPNRLPAPVALSPDGRTAVSLAGRSRRSVRRFLIRHAAHPRRAGAPLRRWSADRKPRHLRRWEAASQPGRG